MIERVELYEVALPLRRPFVTAAVTVTERRVILVRVAAEGLSGWGECGPLPGYSPETIDQAWSALANAGQDTIGTDAAAVPLAGLPPTAAAGLSQAAADLHARLAGLPLWRARGGRRPRVPAGAPVGLQPSLDDLLERIAAEVDAGYRHVKLKIGPGRDREPLGAARDAFPDLALAADANGAYRRADMDHLVGLAEVHLAFLEQPFPAGDIADHALLAARTSMPVVLDESAAVPGWRAALGSARTGIGVTVKPARCPWAEIAAATLLAGTDLTLRVGGMLETGVGRAHAVAAATLPGFTLPTDLSPPSRYLARDVAAPAWVLADGDLVAPDTPGIGVRVDLDALAAATRRKAAFTTHEIVG